QEPGTQYLNPEKVSAWLDSNQRHDERAMKSGDTDKKVAVHLHLYTVNDFILDNPLCGRIVVRLAFRPSPAPDEGREANVVVGRDGAATTSTQQACDPWFRA